MADVLSAYIALIPVTLAQSLILSFVVLAVMIPFRILSFPDLTSEGAYPLGGCVCAVALLNGVPPFPALLLSAAAGFLAGCTTAFIHLRFRIHTLLAGILVTTMLYSINLRVMGKANQPVFREDKIYDMVTALGLSGTYAKMLIAGALAGLVLLLLNLWFATERGTAMRAVGANADMAEAQGINVWRATIGGIGLAGAFAAFGGGLMIQSQGFADVNVGLGILINALAALMIGEAVVGKQTVARQMLAPFAGAVIYYQLISMCLAIGLPPGDLKIATGIFVLIMLAGPALRNRKTAPARREATRL
ncbi:MAG: ABC transporter permease [Zhengella sp.]|uniref:ABC transporter permease n=1 Tax=Zhengella sp. TaxID=2282762 RepID=UPI001D98EEF8|nr:ABC transporter permease [Notoacmeibacter sp.]MCC0025775.1 ABC transporter permease [Brucellaceae bacterium]